MIVIDEVELQGAEKLPLAILTFIWINHYITKGGDLAIFIVCFNGSLESYLKIAVRRTNTAIFDLE